MTSIPPITRAAQQLEIVASELTYIPSPEQRKTRRAKLVVRPGMKFQRLTVIEFSHIGYRGNHFWKVKCDCGNEKTIKTSGLRATVSCGCFVDEVRRTTKRRYDGHQGLINRVLYDYRKHAIERDLEFTLSVESFKKLILSACYYCGQEPSNYKDYPKDSNNGLNYNGIDRIDNDQGYHLFNVVSCCFQCNKAKGTQLFESYIKWIKQLTRYNNDNTK